MYFEFINFYFIIFIIIAGSSITAITQTICLLDRFLDFVILGKALKNFEKLVLSISKCSKSMRLNAFSDNEEFKPEEFPK